MKRFSIIIPFFNSFHYIDKCLNSIIMQSVKDCEIIVVNDGSDDSNYIKLLELINNKEYDIKIISQVNLGPYLARINGAQKANGEYLLFVDSDDELKYDSLEYLNTIIDDYNPDMIQFNATIDLKNETKFLNLSKYENLKCLNKRDIKSLYFDIFKTNNFNNLATKCVRTSLFNSIKFPVIPNFKNGEDLYTSLYLFDNINTLVIIDECLYFYRKNTNSTTHSYSRTFYPSMKLLHKKMTEFAMKWNRNDLLEEERKSAVLSNIRAIQNVFHLNNNLQKTELLKIFNDPFFYNNISNKAKVDITNFSRQEKILYWSLRRKNKFIFIYLYEFTYMVLKKLKIFFTGTNL